MPFLTIRDALEQGTALLNNANVTAPRLTAEVLLCHALGHERSYLFAHPERELREVEWIHYGRYLNERLRGKPTQYITHRQEFYGREFYVAPGVLIPRPETEHLIEAALPLARGVVIDIGAGSGAIAVTLALESQAKIFATDISFTALTIAQRNARTLNAPVHLIGSDLASPIPDISVDLVVSNPPYVSTNADLAREVRDWEPPEALFAGPTGLDVYRRLIPEAARVLRPGGFLALELGFDSLEPVRALLSERWREPQITHDLAGIPRVLVSQKAG